MKNLLYFFPFLMGSLFASDNTFDSGKFAFEAIRFAAYVAPKSFMLGRNQASLARPYGRGVVPAHQQAVIVGFDKKDIARQLLLKHGVQMVATGFKMIRDEKRVLIGNVNAPIITDHDIRDTIAAGSFAAGVTVFADGWVSPSRMARAAGKAAVIQFVENKIIDVAQAVNDKFQLIDQNSLCGAAVEGAGRFAAQYVASAAVEKFVRWPYVPVTARPFGNQADFQAGFNNVQNRQ